MGFERIDFFLGSETVEDLPRDPPQLREQVDGEDEVDGGILEKESGNGLGKRRFGVACLF